MTHTRPHILAYARFFAVLVVITIVFCTPTTNNVVKKHSVNSITTVGKAVSGNVVTKNNEVVSRNEIPEGWIQKIQSGIESLEYHISFDECEKLYQSPNRKHNLRAYYAPGKFNLQNRIDTTQNWKLALTNTGIYANNEIFLTAQENATVITNCDTVRFIHRGFTEEYINNCQGIRQNFIIHEKPAKGDKLEIKLKPEGLKVNVAGNNEIHFYAENEKGLIEKKLTYTDLTSWDAKGQALLSSLQYEDGFIVLHVDITNAAFPVTIDPLSTTSDWSAESNQNLASFGYSIATAGDVNGDGYSDVIIGSYLFDNGQSNEGRAFVYHGSATGLSVAAAWTAESNQLGGNFGFAVSSAGDVNGDGFSDVIVGAHNYDSPEVSEGRVYVYHGSATGLAVAAALTVESNQAGAIFGAALACAGDVNGDGFSDVIVGSNLYDNGEANEGRAFVYHGSATGINPAVAWTAESNQANAQFGFCVASAGDVNGDGFSDVIVGSYLYDNGETDEGRAFIYHGSATGLNAVAAWTNESNQTSASFGRSVSCAGDVNGDGFSDVIVGAYSFANGQNFEGRAFVYHGSVAGTNAVAAWTTESDQVNAQYGSAVGCAGDVNGDGYSDVVVGCFLFDNGNLNEGRDYVYHGSSAGLSVVPAWTFELNQDGAQLGTAVAPAGDVNGDGYSDLIVGAHLYDNGSTDEGAVFEFHGSASGLAAANSVTIESDQTLAQFAKSIGFAGDVNGDGYSDIIVGAHLFDNGQADEGRAFVFHGGSFGINAVVPAWTAESNQASAQFGISVSGAGDVNGDGYSDVIIGSNFYDNGQANEGRAFVYHGSAAGLGLASSWTAESEQAAAEFGISVYSAGDVNSDGYSDVIVGSHLFDNGNVNEGAAFVYHGSATGLGAAAAWTAEGNQTSAQFGISVSGAGDVNSDRYSDVIIGSNLFDNGNTDEGRAFVFHGAATGLALTAAWTGEANQNAANYGISVACAGDINGDGFNDVIVGANLFDNGQVNEGRAYVYTGSVTGLSLTATTIESNLAGANFGVAVSSAGDVNGNSYSEVLVGANNYTNVEANEGAVYLFSGSSAGLVTTAAWISESNQASASYGISVACIGDVNADGYSDVLIGSSLFDNGQVDEGRAWAFYGNNGTTSARNSLRLYNDDLISIINVANIPVPSFGIGLHARSFIGRTSAKLVWESRFVDASFSTSSGSLAHSCQFTAQQIIFTDLGTTGLELKDLVTKLVNQTKTKVRARIRYSMVTAITGQMYGPWRYPAGFSNGGTIHNIIPLPVELVEFTATENGNTADITWTTATEINSDYFMVERSVDLIDWEEVGRVEAAGNSSKEIEYLFTDKLPLQGVSYYRLRMVDGNGEFSFSDIDVVKFESQGQYTFYPNPFDNVIFVKAENIGEFTVDVYNSLGQRMDCPVEMKNQTALVETNSLSKGTYVIVINQSGAMVSKTLVK